MTDAKRLIQAIFISPLAALPIRAVDMAATGLLWEVDVGQQLLVVLISALVAVVLFGLPVHLLLVRMRIARPIFYAIPGFIAPAAFTAYWLDLSVTGIGIVIHLIGLVGVSGACVALAFRYLALGTQARNEVPH